MAKNSVKPAAAIGTLFYEFEQFIYSLQLGGRQLEKAVSDPHLGRMLGNACLESTLLHARILLEFFGKDTGGNKVLADHYGFSKGPVTEAERLKRRLHNDLAHVSYDRLERAEATQRVWSESDLLPLVEHCYDFLEHLESGEWLTDDVTMRRHQCLKEAFGRARSAVPANPGEERPDRHTVSARPVVQGRVKGPALVCSKAFSFLGDVDMDTGQIIAQGHEHEGECIAGRVMIYPETKGSSGGCVVLTVLARQGKQPAAIVLEKPADPNIVEGAIVSGVALVCEPREDLLTAVPNGALVTVDGSTGQVSWAD